MVAVWSRGSWSTVCPTSWSRCFSPAKPVLRTFDWYCRTLQRSLRSSFTYGLGLQRMRAMPRLEQILCNVAVLAKDAYGNYVAVLQIDDEQLEGLANVWLKTQDCNTFTRFTHPYGAASGCPAHVGARPQGGQAACSGCDLSVQVFSRCIFLIPRFSCPDPRNHTNDPCKHRWLLQPFGEKFEGLCDLQVFYVKGVVCGNPV